MAKKRKQRPFATRGSSSAKQRAVPVESGGLFAFFRDFGVRETIESIIIAVVLALTTFLTLRFARPFKQAARDEAPPNGASAASDQAEQG